MGGKTLKLETGKLRNKLQIPYWTVKICLSGCSMTYKQKYQSILSSATSESSEWKLWNFKEQ